MVEHWEQCSMLYAINYILYGRTILAVTYLLGVLVICIFIFIYIYPYIYGYNLFVILYTCVVLVWMIEYRHPHLLLVMLIVKYRQVYWYNVFVIFIAFLLCILYSMLYSTTINYSGCYQQCMLGAIYILSNSSHFNSIP